jgi:hypothetical protein
MEELRLEERYRFKFRHFKILSPEQQEQRSSFRFSADNTHNRRHFINNPDTNTKAFYLKGIDVSVMKLLLCSIIFVLGVNKRRVSRLTKGVISTASAFVEP